MAMFTADKAMRSMEKTPVVLKYILHDMTNERAKQLAPTAKGWNALEVMCHLVDIEEVYFVRAKRIIAENKPEFPAVDQEALVTEHDYAHQDIRDTAYFPSPGDYQNREPDSTRELYGSGPATYMQRLASRP